MKPTIIVSSSALLAGALANTAQPAHSVADLLARALDPATMDPTKFSVLSVLKTAMTTTGTGTEVNLPTGTAAPQWYKDLPADVMVLLAQMYPATPNTAAMVSDMAASASTSAPKGSISQTTLTKTLELVPTATRAVNGSLSTGVESGTQANATTLTGEVSPTQSALSRGAKNASSVGMWSVVVGFGVAAVFCFFA